MPSYLRKISKHTLIYGIGGISEKALTFLLIPLYTNFLNTDDYGRLTLFRITISVILMIAGLGILQALYRFYYQHSHQEKEDYVVGTAFFTLVGFTSTISVLLIIFAEKFSHIYFGTAQYKTLFIIIFITVLFDAFNTFSFALLRIHEKSTRYVVISLIGLICSLALNIYFVAILRIGIKGVLLSSLISGIIMFLIFLPDLFSRVRFRYSMTILKELLNFGLPLVPASIGGFILISSDMFFLKHYSTIDNVGIYSLAYKFGLLVSVLVVNPFDTTWAPLKYKAVNEKDSDQIYSNVLTWFTFIAIFIALTISALVKDVLTVISGQQYLSAYKFVVFITFSYVIYGMYRIVCLGMDMAKKTRLRALVIAASACINLILNYLLIPKFQVSGAATSTLLSYLFMATCTYLLSQKFFHIKYQITRLPKMFLVAIILYVIASAIDTNSIIINFVIKTILVLMFPMGLCVIRFYSTEELIKSKQIVRSILKTLIPKAINYRGRM